MIQTGLFLKARGKKFGFLARTHTPREGFGTDLFEKKLDQKTIRPVKDLNLRPTG